LESLVVSIPFSVIADFGQHPGSEDQPCPRQAPEYLAVRMLVQELLDLLLVALDLTEEGLELGIDPHQSIQATRANM